MDTFILLPEELFLSVGRYAPRNCDDGGQGDSGPPGRYPPRPWGLSVWTAVPLQAGTRFTTTQGSMVMARLGCTLGNRHHPDVWSNYGCYEEMRPGPNRYERHCNWVCFLRSADHRDDANVLVYKIKGSPVFEVSRFVQAYTELSAFFQVTDHSICSILRTDSSPSYVSLLQPASTKLDRHTIGQSTHRQLGQLSAESSPTNTSLHSSRGVSSTRHYPASGRLANLHKGAPMWTSSRRGKERTALPCDVCGKSFDRPSLLRRHMRTHTGEKPHMCNVCGKAFSTSSSLNTHCRIHSGEKPHVCGVCGKRFTASSNLYYHRMTHRKDKPHKCTMCCKSFPTPGDLRSHMFVHNGSWPFKCQFCNRGFSKHTNLKNHIMLHTGEKPHICVLCGKRFALICNLRSHSKTHQIGQNIIQCRSSNKP